MITVLSIGDPHFQENNKVEYDEMIEKVLNYARKHPPTYIVIMGDTLHKFKTMHQDPHYDACQFFYRLKEIAPLFVLIGNHDRRSNSEFMTEKNPFHSLRETGITIVPKTYSFYEPTLEKSFVFVPYVPKGRFKEGLNYNGPINYKEVATIFSHHEPRNCEMNGIISEDGDELDPEYPFIICGHIHKYQKIGRLVCVGTPMQHTIAETEEKSISLFTFLKGERDPTEERIFLNCKRKKAITLSVTQLEDWEWDPSISWRITLQDTREALALVQSDKRYRELEKNGVMFSERRIEEDEPELPVAPIESSDYLELLWKRIEDEPRQRAWLKILMEDK